ncbi:MAG TPA: ABC transporter permease [Anaerolineales bacterium]
MRNTLIILKHEFLTTIARPSFWIVTFLFPVVVVVLTFGTQWITQNNIQNNTSNTPSESGKSGENNPAIQRNSYVDLAGLIKKAPPGVSEAMLNPYPDERSAQEALNAGKIEWYAVIPADYVQTGRLVLIQRSFNPLAKTPENFFQYILAYNLTGDAGIAGAISRGTPSTVLYNLAPATETSQGPTNGAVRSLLPYATLFLFFMLISTSSGLMLNSVSKEKSSRMAEVLLLSLRPRDLMAGKILGLSLVALFQLFAWAGGALLFMKEGRSVVEGLSQVTLPAGFLVWVVLFYFLGYLLYASLMGAIGALAPDLREAGQFTFLLLMPLIVPLAMNTAFADAPNGGPVTFLSLFPLTAPTAMLTRIASTSVPFWQIAASLGMLAITTYLVVLLAARFFRPETLLSNASLKWAGLLAELRHAVSGRS